MMTTFSIPYPLLQAILAEMQRRPYHLAVGAAGVSQSRRGDTEILARSFRLVHEGALRDPQNAPTPQFELGYVPFTLDRPDVWQAIAFAARVEDDLPAAPTCSLMLGSGRDLGLFTGIFRERDQIAPVEVMNVVGAGMHRLGAVDFPPYPHSEQAPADRERWGRLIGALGGPEVWQRLTALSFCIVGVGRTGSLVAATLARQGIRSLTLIDPDRLEMHNLDAMDAVTESDLGRFKAEALRDNLQRDLPHVAIRALPQSALTAAARDLIKSADILIGCVDDDAARLALGGLACCYAKPYLDLGTGVFSEVLHLAATQTIGHRQLGADVRLILPGDGCLLCWGGVQNAPTALQRWRSGTGRRSWNEERAGSLRSLNALAAHSGLRLIEDMVSGHLRQSVWFRHETDAHGIPSLRRLSGHPRPGCPLCAVLGAGDLLARPAAGTDPVRHLSAPPLARTLPSGTP